MGGHGEQTQGTEHPFLTGFEFPEGNLVDELLSGAQPFDPYDVPLSPGYCPKNPFPATEKAPEGTETDPQAEKEVEGWLTLPGAIQEDAPASAPAAPLEAEPAINHYDILVDMGLKRLETPGAVLDPETSLADMVQHFNITDSALKDVVRPLAHAVFHMVKYKYEVKIGRTERHLGGFTYDTSSVFSFMDQFKTNVSRYKANNLSVSWALPIPDAWKTVPEDLKADHKIIMGSPETRAALLRRFEEARAYERAKNARAAHSQDNPANKASKKGRKEDRDDLSSSESPAKIQLTRRRK